MSRELEAARQWAAERIATLRDAADGLERLHPSMKCEYYREEAAHLEALLIAGNERPFNSIIPIPRNEGGGTA